MNRIPSAAMIAMLASMVSVTQPAHATEASWLDPASGREYLLLDGPRTFDQTFSACQSQGMAIYDPRFVSDAEQKALLNSPLIDALAWTDAARGAQLAYVWNAAEGLTITWNAPSPGATVQILVRRPDQQVRSTSEQRGQDQTGINGICISVDDFWYRCGLEYRCVYPNGADGQFAVRYLFSDYGATENETMTRLIQTTQDPRWSISEGQCAIRTETQHCTRLLP